VAARAEVEALVVPEQAEVQVRRVARALALLGVPVQEHRAPVALEQQIALVRARPRMAPEVWAEQEVPAVRERQTVLGYEPMEFSKEPTTA